MISLPTFMLEGKKIPRLIFSLRATGSVDGVDLLSLTKELYGMGIWCFDLPSPKHLDAFRELKGFTEDEHLFGFGHVDVEEGVSLLSQPIHRFESKILSTIHKNLFTPQLVRGLKEMGAWNSRHFLPIHSSPDVFTQKEIDRITFDTARFEKTLFRFNPSDTPFLFLGGKYADWLLGLGRIDLLRNMTVVVKKRGFVPLFAAHWTTFVLPKAKSIDAAAYAAPINKNRILLDLAQGSTLIKKFDRPLIGLDPLADGELSDQPEEAFGFLFRELKIHAVILEITSEKDAGTALQALENIPFFIPPRKT